jgi:hypothetical protein
MLVTDNTAIPVPRFHAFVFQQLTKIRGLALLCLLQAGCRMLSHPEHATRKAKNRPPGGGELLLQESFLRYPAEQVSATIA